MQPLKAAEFLQNQSCASSMTSSSLDMVVAQITGSETGTLSRKSGEWTLGLVIA